MQVRRHVPRELAGSWQSGVTNEPLGYWLITEGGWNLFFFPKVYREIIWKVTPLKFASLTTPFSSLNQESSEIKGHVLLLCSFQPNLNWRTFA